MVVSMDSVTLWNPIHSASSSAISSIKCFNFDFFAGLLHSLSLETRSANDVEPRSEETAGLISSPCESNTAARP